MRKELQKPIIIWHNPIPEIIDLILHIFQSYSIQFISQPETNARKVLNSSEIFFY